MKWTIALSLCAALLSGSALAATVGAADVDTVEESAIQAKAFLQQAENAAQRGDTLAAVQLYQSAIIFAPMDVDVYNQVAQFYASSKQPDMAEKYFDIALDVDPANPLALKGLALLDLAAGNLAGARAQHDLLVRACGESCPETAQVEKALSAGASGVSN
jgi:Flp pilus assembly protein TadD